MSIIDWDVLTYLEPSSPSCVAAGTPRSEAGAVVDVFVVAA